MKRVADAVESVHIAQWALCGYRNGYILRNVGLVSKAEICQLAYGWRCFYRLGFSYALKCSAGKTGQLKSEQMSGRSSYSKPNPVTVNSNRNMKTEKYCSQFSTYFKRHTAFRKADESLVCSEKNLTVSSNLLYLLRLKTSTTSVSSIDE
jgi:hypothetical protein